MGYLNRFFNKRQVRIIIIEERYFERRLMDTMFWRILFHLFMTSITGGFWLLILLIRFLIK